MNREDERMTELMRRIYLERRPHVIPSTGFAAHITEKYNSLVEWHHCLTRPHIIQNIEHNAISAWRIGEHADHIHVVYPANMARQPTRTVTPRFLPAFLLREIWFYA